MSAGSVRRGKNMGSKVCTRWASPLTGCEILGKSLSLGEPVSLAIKLG